MINSGLSIKQAAKAAFPYSMPIATGFIFLGMAYGIYMKALGFHMFYPILMAATIYAGSVEFIVAGLLVANFAPLNVLLITLMVSGRQIFYGISMLDKYRHTGNKKIFLVSTLVDESFSLNYMAQIPAHIDKNWYMFFVSLYLYLYWIAGAALGGIFGSTLPFDLTGVDFAMTALFLVIFAEQWRKESNHESSLLGLGAACTCLLLFGKEQFLLPTLLLIWLLLSFRRRSLETKLAQQG